jgi:hypothetical protein
MFSRVLFVTLLALAPHSASAQTLRRPPVDVPPHLVMERLSRMTPEERDRLLANMSPKRRMLLEDRLGKYTRMPTEAKQRLREEYDSFHQLPPEKQDEVRKLYKQFSELPDDRRRTLRRELVRLRNMPEQRRAGRMQSERFQSEYSESERALLTNLVEILARHPSQPPPSN